MKIPVENNPQHVLNLETISLLKAQGFEGIDRDLAISLFEYGLIWRTLPTGEFLFVYPHTSLPNKFDRGTIDNLVDLRKEFNWVDWDGMSFTNCPLDNWLDLPLPLKINDLVNHYGVENIFGTSYWEGFEIKED